MLKSKVVSVLANVFNVAPEMLSLDSSPKTIKEWNSLRHMTVVLALEDEFNIQYSDEEIGALDSVHAIVESLQKHHIT